MKSKVRRTILMILIAVILFSAAMSIPGIYYSSWKNLILGAAIGLMFASVISIITIIVEHFKSNNTTK